MSSDDFRALYRADLDCLKNGLFLNFAATAPLSRTVIEKLKTEVEEMKAPLGQRFYQCLNNLEHARRGFAELIGAKGCEIAFTQNTSSAISTIALSIQWSPGDKVLVADNEFPSNYYPWVNLKHQGVICEKFSPERNIPIVETLKKTDLTGVKLISLSAVSYQTGRLYELADFVNFCRDNGIYSCLDSIQAIGSVPFDVREIGMDFACSGAQKWLMGPVGCGLIYVREALLEKLHVPYVGWTSTEYPENFELGDLTFSPEMTRFEPGLPNYLAVMGMHHSLMQLKSLGWSNIFSAIGENTRYLQNGLTGLGFELLTGDRDLTAGIVSFIFPEGFDHRTVEEAYAKKKIKITTRDNYVRVSPQFFNMQSELDIFLQSTQEIFRKTKSVQVTMTTKIRENPPAISVNKILIAGAGGHLGQALTWALARRGFSLHLVDKNQSALKQLAQDISAQFSAPEIETVDFSVSSEVEKFFDRLKTNGASKYAGLVNCAGIVETSLFEELKSQDIAEMLKINIEFPTHLLHLFLTELRAPKALGVLNVVSSTGRCGSPLLAVYGATHAALWTLGESLAREYSDQDLAITTFVAPAMHSPMQKRMGRISLRFVRMSGVFPFALAENVAEDAVEGFLLRKNVHVAKANRLKIAINSLLPSVIDKKIRAVWRKN